MSAAASPATMPERFPIRYTPANAADAISGPYLHDALRERTMKGPTGSVLALFFLMPITGLADHIPDPIRDCTLRLVDALFCPDQAPARTSPGNTGNHAIPASSC